MVKNSAIAGIKQIPIMKYLGIGISGSYARMEKAIKDGVWKATQELWRVTKSSSCRVRTTLMRTYLDSVMRY
jgi:hypothetical protein